MKERATRQAVDDQLARVAPRFLKSFPGIQMSFHSCVSTIAVAIECGHAQDAEQAIQVVSEHLAQAESAWTSEAIQQLRVESRRDLLTVLDTPRDLRDEIDLMEQEIPAETMLLVEQMRVCSHCLDAADSALVEMIEGGRETVLKLYHSSW